jgi:hypothetical protein
METPSVKKNVIYTYRVLLKHFVSGHRKELLIEPGRAQHTLFMVLTDYLNSDAARDLLEGYQISSIVIANGESSKAVSKKLITDLVSHYRKRHLKQPSAGAMVGFGKETLDVIHRTCNGSAGSATTPAQRTAASGTPRPTGLKVPG